MPDATPHGKLRATHYNEIKDSDALLLVEGEDDWHSLTHIMRMLFPEYSNHFRLAYCGGIDEVYKTLNAESIATQRKNAIGAVIDADNASLSSVLQRVRNSIGDEYIFPASWPETGLIAKSKNSTAGSTSVTRIGVWCMPDNDAQGIFEDLLNRAIPDLSKQFIEETLTTALNRKHASFPEIQRPKAVLRTHMAWNAPDCSKYGQAISRDLFPKEELLSHFQPFLNWAQRVFGQ